MGSKVRGSKFLGRIKKEKAFLKISMTVSYCPCALDRLKQKGQMRTIVSGLTTGTVLTKITYTNVVSLQLSGTAEFILG